MRKLKPLAERLSKTMLQRLYDRKITNAQAADALGVSETHLSRTVAAIQGKVPGVNAAVRAAATKLHHARRTTRTELAKKVLADQLTIAQAAKRAKVSERTMFRYVALYRK